MYENTEVKTNRQHDRKENQENIRKTAANKILPPHHRSLFILARAIKVTPQSTIKFVVTRGKVDNSKHSKSRS